MNAREPEPDFATRADLGALKTDLIRELASKAEVERLRADLTAAIAALDSRIGRLGSAINGRISGVESTINGTIARLDTMINGRIRGLEGTLRTLMWSGGIIGAIVGAAAVKELFGW